MVAHEKLPEWFEPFKKVVLTSKQGDKVGATHHIFNELDGLIKVEWDSETTEWIENELYSWRSIGGHFTNFGSITLRPAKEGTKVTLELDYHLPYSVIGQIVDKLRVHKEIDKSIDSGLKKLKDMLEK